MGACEAMLFTSRLVATDAAILSFNLNAIGIPNVRLARNVLLTFAAGFN